MGKSIRVGFKPKIVFFADPERVWKWEKNTAIH
jgi:hypothetical protein